MPIVHLTQAMIDKGLPVPPGQRRIEYCCSEVPGLLAEVRETSPDVPTWYWRRKVQQKTSYMRLGTTRDLTLAEARRKVKALKAERTLGIGTGGAAASTSTVPTLAEFFDNSYLPHVKSRLRSWRKCETIFRLRVRDRFGSARMDQLKRQDLQVWHAELVAGGLSEASADHGLKLVRQMTNLAVEWGVLTVSPIGRVRLFNPDNRQLDDFLSPEEFSRYLATLRSYPNRPVALLLEFLVATGARLREALGARWEHIDRAARTWHVPAAQSKSRRIRTIPLSDAALQILDLLGTEGKSPQLFVSDKTGKPLHHVHKTIERINAKAGLTRRVKAHTLRRQWAMHALDAGRTIVEVSRVLGHASVQTTDQRYAGLSAKTLLAAANEASAVLLRPTTEPEAEQPAAA